ncbi:DUF4232 domain-containing protein [Streptomyces iconiensis]|uniref:DUF4232 domain-containing protein n=1 Tax=Streptomyces iconiensis TaxID=1384038 RepID=A0ABT7A0I2_9ACTN|nr:DUF4232 domain-containing protein [Streptomyces iconiensis]MDJ1134830.1 DUF4232 domain-containing protein [Streptomyces iconiensis]
MKYTRTAAIAALGVAAALSLTACGGDDSGKENSGKSSSSSSASSSGSSEDSKTGNSASGSDDTEARAAKNGAGQDAEGAKFCAKSGLSMTAADEGPDEKSGNVVVTMTNTTGGTCSVTGFPTVRLTDADHTTSAPLKRDDNQPRIAVLKPNEKAVFNISFDKAKGGEPSDSDPVDLQVTPPHGKGFVKLHWPAGAIKGMSNATALVHPVHANP